MLVYNLVMDAKGELYEKRRKRFFDALGTSDVQSHAWFQPRALEHLPNLKQVKERDFWSWRSSQGFVIEAWCGQIEVDAKYLLSDERKWGTLLLYFLDNSYFLMGGFAVLVNTNGPGVESVKYFEWKACDHKFHDKNIGRCLHLYTCEKCGESFEIDSSD